MRKIVMLLFFVFSFSLCIDVMASDIKDEDVVTIPINTGDSEDNKKNNPRNIIICPIACLYYNGSFAFSFYEAFEDVTIRIENASTGEQWFRYMEYSESSVVIPASFDAGTYNISIYADGEYYTGIFQK